MFRSTLSQVLMLKCVYCMANSLNLTDSNTGLSYQEGSHATFTCIIQPYNYTQKWTVDSVKVAECGIVSCGVFSSNPSEFSFSPSINTGVFKFTINPFDSKYKNAVIGCFDGSSTVNLTIDITVVDSNDETSGKLSAGVIAAIIIVVCLVVLVITACVICVYIYSAKYRIVLRTKNLDAVLKDNATHDKKAYLSKEIEQYLKRVNQKGFKVRAVRIICMQFEMLAFDICVYARTDVTETLQVIFGQTNELHLNKMIVVTDGYVMKNKDETTTTLAVYDEVVVQAVSRIPASYTFPFAYKLQTQLLENHDLFLATVSICPDTSNVSINVVFEKASPGHERETSKLNEAIEKLRFKDIQHPGFQHTQEDQKFMADIPRYMLKGNNSDAIVDAVAQELQNKLQIDGRHISSSGSAGNKIVLQINCQTINQEISDEIITKGTVCRYKLVTER